MVSKPKDSSSEEKLLSTAREIDGAEELDENERPEERKRTILAFFMFGLLIYATYSLIIAGAQDILQGTLVPTSAVLVANIGPYFLVTLVAPYFIQKVPYFPRVLAIFTLEVAGLIMVVVGKHVAIKLFGVSLSSIGFGLGELSFIAMTSHYHEVAVRAFSAGTGAGISLAPLYYTAMTTWACIPPNTAISIMAVCMVLILAFYGIMDRRHSDEPPSPGDSFMTVPYAPLGDDSNDEKSGGAMTWKDKAYAVRGILPIMLSVIFAWIAEYLIIQAVITTIAFTNAPFPPRDHYQYYIFVFLGGELFGRSYLVLMSFWKPQWIPRLIIRRLWILALVEIAHLVFFAFAAWYRFLPSVAIPLILAFTAGVIIGVMYVNMLAVYTEESDPVQREFVLGYASAATGCGALTAGLLGLAIEPWLRHHCLQVSASSDYCFTRAIDGVCFKKNL
ncbi:protein BTN1-like [Nematostella vectensis]|uniref:protein BTN1-like n=1 Tax=Nematostella vectensis TaxID=45351 RepID=UPI0020777ACC|nr:protein BTN1-like [Nematostella vectensis]